jgi:CheY-like chemotaxis protein
MAQSPSTPDLADEKVNILIVDDRPDKLLAHQVLLEELDQNLVKATSGKEALRCLLKQEFAVILLDVNMPGMDGFETASMIRQRAAPRRHRSSSSARLTTPRTTSRAATR